jgi:hypothetical protein
MQRGLFRNDFQRDRETGENSGNVDMRMAVSTWRGLTYLGPPTANGLSTEVPKHLYRLPLKSSVDFEFSNDWPDA